MYKRQIAVVASNPFLVDDHRVEREGGGRERKKETESENKSQGQHNKQMALRIIHSRTNKHESWLYD